MPRLKKYGKLKRIGVGCMKVTKVKKKKKETYTIEFDNQASLDVSEDLLIEFRLIKGNELDQAEWERLRHKASYDRGLQLALTYISYQLRTVQEVNHFLQEKGFNREQQKKIIQRLADLRVIDDAFYAESYIRTQLALSDKGPKQIQQKLKQKGINDEIIQKALHLFDEQSERELALKTAIKLNKKIHHKSHRERLQKIRLGLLQKGYHSSIIEQVMEQLAIEADEQEEKNALEKAGMLVWNRNSRLPFTKRKQKVKQALYSKGFASDAIQEFIDKECIDDTEEI